MGDLDDIDFGADTDAIRRWLAKRATYAEDPVDPVRGGKHRVDPPGTVDPQRLSVPNARDAGRDVLAALVTPVPPAPRKYETPFLPPERTSEEPAEVPPPADATEIAGPADAEVEPAQSSHPATPTSPTGTKPNQASPYASTPEEEERRLQSRSTNAVFKPRHAARNVITGVVILVAALTVGAGYLAYQERTNVMYGLVVLLIILTIIVWAVRATTTVTELAVIRGQLEMIHDGKFEVIDLASPYTPVLVEGRAGHRSWRVFIERHDRPLLEIDSSVVDPHHFTAVLQQIRPELRSDRTTD
ncbi:hypothetical protein [Nocardioides pelophilus]|uniref:hypothetical protein n=1 Tax=Nocardioides pelophilus TaxID=2172019 RepID=UPI0016012CAB|nr:hypothetical protein [Nocardioides pelophilus]